MGIFLIVGLLQNSANETVVTGYLYFASSASQQSVSNQRLEPSTQEIDTLLKKTFPDRHLDLLGKHEQRIHSEYESWIVPSREFFIKLVSQGELKDQGLKLHLQFWKETEILLKADIVLHSGKPIVIKGPSWKEGQLFFVLSYTPINQVSP
jgi:hypothetical protein